MKTMRFISPGKALLTLPSGMLLSALLCGACSDADDEGRSQEKTIGFAVTALKEDGWNEGGKREAGAERGKENAEVEVADTLPATCVFALKGEAPANGRELFLHALTTGGIETANDGADAAEEIGATGDGNRGARTKAEPVKTATMHAEAGVFAFIYPASGTWDGTAQPNYIYDAKIKKADAWATTYNWPGAAHKMGFFAYAPYRSAGLSFSPASTPGAPVMTYDVPASVLSQPDLLTAHEVDVAGNRNSSLPLTFRHVLTAVRFETGSHLLPGTITKISLKGVYGKASHRMGGTEWNTHSGKRDFGQAMNVPTPDPESPGTAITSPAVTFMMLPQTLPLGAKIEVEYKDNLTNTPRTLTADIEGSVWPMGKTITYRISTSSISVNAILNVIAPTDFEHTGGTQHYQVISYLEVKRMGDPVKTIPMPWTVKYSTDNGNSWDAPKPAWLTAFTESGPGGATSPNLPVTVQAQAKVVTEPHNNILRAAQGKINWNLSNPTGAIDVKNTANCYVVNAPGTYRLPLVYGNAIKNGSANGSAYTSSANGTNVLKKFINHKGAAISHPYIKNNAGCTPQKAMLVWQDAKDLVTHVALSGDFLTFTVERATIKQGNAVVAVQNAADEIMWSWHIWVTDYVLGTDLKTVTNYQHQTYTLLPVNIGWCDETKENYAGREVKIRFIQQTTAGHLGTAETVTVRQKAKEIIYIGNSTYYQWGRKDPFVGAYAGNINKTWYDTGGNVKNDQPPLTESFSTGNPCITSGIAKPNTFCTNSYMDDKYANLWSVNNTDYTANDNPVVKTIYDPSPVGYKLPPSNVFTGFTPTGSNVNSFSSLFNVSGAWDKGWNFYCGLNQTGDTVFFPASGRRLFSNATLGAVGTHGYFRTAIPYYYDESWGWILFFSKDFVFPLNYNKSYRSYGYDVRPCKE